MLKKLLHWLKQILSKLKARIFGLFGLNKPRKKDKPEFICVERKLDRDISIPLRKLGHTDIDVSLICLGTMTFGEQNTQGEGFAQMDYAYERGVNFIDVAEMYPVPPKSDTYGDSEIIVGNWLKERGLRDKIVLATKVTGNAAHNAGFDHIRGGPDLSAGQITEAIEGSLKRLQTDYVDLYQLHWPDRKTNFFGKLGYQHDPDDQAINLHESMEAMSNLVKAGKVRAVGLSNETPWGLMECLRLAKEYGLSRVVSVQNPYNLLNRTYEVGLAEMSIREQAGLLAYSPLAFGMLTGKYLNGAQPKGARLTLFGRFSRYTNPQAQAATAEYAKLAEQHGLSLTDMSMAFVNQQPFLTSNIVGATSVKQLQEIINSLSITLSDEVLDGIGEIHQRFTNPAP